MKKINNKGIILAGIMLLALTQSLIAEGTKELMPDSADAKNARILVANGNAGGNLRDPFALYNGDTNYRLKVYIKDHTREAIYYGIGQSTGASVNWRIHEPDGTIVWTGATPTTGTGYISFASQAYAGPNYFGPAGYPARVYYPTKNGEYFMTFQIPNNSYRVYKYFDITVVDTIDHVPRKGRVFSKCWQLSTNEPNVHGFFGLMYPYSTDGLVTKFDPNGFDGRWFSVCCNESGCYQISPTHPANEARKSTEGWHNYPQYKIFVNDPDSLVYPSGLLGTLVQNTPVVQTTSYCSNGTIDFDFEVTAPGSVSIVLQLSTLGLPYTDRTLQQNVLTGWNTLVWDGYDGSTPANLVPNGSSFNFTLTYINGITHLPLWDVENNPSGFKVALIRPLGPEPNFYWDDTNLAPAMPPGPTTNPPGGCVSSVSPCHLWSGGSDPGDDRTVNTWWYVANTSTSPVVIQKKQLPDDPGPISGPNIICQGSNAQYTVSAGVNTAEYHWVWPGGEDTTLVPIITISIPLNAPTGPGQVTVHGINAECGDGPVSTLNITINPVPSVNNPTADTICSGTSPAITLTSTPPGASFSWITPAPTCTPNILACPPGNIGTMINNVLTLTNLSPGLVTYHITPNLNGCDGAVHNIAIAVSPIPDVNINSTTPTLCSGGTTNIQLSSTVPGTVLNWTATSSSPNLSGFALSGTGNILEPIYNSGFTTEWVTFSILPDANGCQPTSPTNYTVTVYPIPNTVINSTTPSLCSGQTTNILLSSSVAGTVLNWTTTASSPNIGGYPANGNGNILLTLTNSGTTIETLTFHILPVANGCSPATDTSYVVTVFPLPVPLITGLNAICSGFSTGYKTQAGMTGYNWSVTAGGSIVNGSGTDSVTILWTTPGAQTVSLNYIDTNGCTANSPTVFNVTVNSLPVPTIAGNDSLCNTTSAVYTTQPGMTGYLWNLPPGGTITAGGGTNAITVLWNTPGTHTLTVNYTNSTNCTAVNPTTYTVRVFPLPVPIITGPAAMCLNQTAAYTTQSGMTGYTWTVTGGTIVSGTGTDSVNVHWTSTGSQTLTLTFTDPKGCNPAAPTVYSVMVNTLPVPTITGSNAQCAGTSTTYTTEAGMSSYTWNVSAGGSITSGAGTSTITVLWSTAGAQTVSVNYVVGTGCTAPSPTIKNVTVNPLPAPAISGPAPVCELSTQVYTSPAFGGHSYNWTVTGGTIQSGQGTASINVLWGVAGAAMISLVETITATGCSATAAPFNLTLNPYPLAAGVITGPPAVCENSSGISYSIPTVTFATTYAWSYTGSGVTIINNGNSITVNFALGATSGMFSVHGVNACGDGPSSSFNVTVNPIPIMSHITCNDPITITTAQPFRLKGATPLGGTYSGSGVSAGIFTPSVAGPGTHVITYSYTNTYTCSASITFPINVISPAAFACNNSLTDIRDNKQYPTVSIGGRCWMAANLNYGTVIPSSAMQRDNCVPEKYCFGDNSANCATQGGLYQWDELMQFTSAAGSQGLCPPGWHVPTENEWNILFTTYISVGFAGDPIKYTGYSGFNAFLWGMRHENVQYDFFNFSSFFWTSVSDGPNKAWAHGLNVYTPSVSSYPGSRSNAFAVRCVKD